MASPLSLSRRLCHHSRTWWTWGCWRSPSSLSGSTGERPYVCAPHDDDVREAHKLNLARSSLLSPCLCLSFSPRCYIFLFIFAPPTSPSSISLSLSHIRACRHLPSDMAALAGLALDPCPLLNLGCLYFDASPPRRHPWPQSSTQPHLPVPRCFIPSIVFMATKGPAFKPYSICRDPHSINGGEMVLGGVDESHFVGERTWAPVTREVCSYHRQ